MAARRVAEENRHLRDLLHKQGFSDEYIAHYLQAALNSGPQPSSLSPPTPTQFPASNPSGPAVQSLQSLLAPRRPAGIDPNVQATMPGQASRETSITSGSTSTSALWETSPQAMAATYNHQHAMNIQQGAAVSPPVTQAYPNTLYSAESTPRMETYASHQPPPPPPTQHHPQHQSSMVEDHHPQSYPARQIPDDMSTHPLNYNAQAAAFHTNPRGYGAPGGYC